MVHKIFPSLANNERHEWLVVLLLMVFNVSTWAAPSLNVPLVEAELKVDGKLDEACYQAFSPLEQFVVAGKPGLQPQRTRAWMFWEPSRLIFAFECEDTNIVATAKSANESDVDFQDRVELFLWSGREQDAYACLEIGARGAVHDYLARFYRKFDSTWSPAGWKYAVTPTARGYCVEAEISRRALEKLGFQLKPGTRLRAGFFRADFSSRDSKAEPTWITWVDAAGPKPDFHVAESFGEIELAEGKEKPPSQRR